MSKNFISDLSNWHYPFLYPYSIHTVIQRRSRFILHVQLYNIDCFRMPNVVTQAGLREHELTTIAFLLQLLYLRIVKS